MAETAHEAGVRIITGDTKVVERGGADGVYINTAGVGEVPTGVVLNGANCRPGDPAILVSGTLGDHGIAIAEASARAWRFRATSKATLRRSII